MHGDPLTTSANLSLFRLGSWLLSDAFRKLAFTLLIIFLPLSKAVAEGSIIAALLSWTFSGHIRKVFQRPLHLTPLLLFAVLLSLMAVPQEYLLIAGKGVWKWLRILAVFWIFYSLCIQSAHRLPRFFLILFLGSMTVVVLDGFFQFVFGADFLRQMPTDPGRLPRMKACLSAPTQLAFFISLALPLLAYLIYHADEAKKHFSKYFYVTVWLFFFLAFILTFSRGAMMAAIFSFLFLALRIRINPLSILFFIAGGLLLLNIPQIRFNFVETLSLQDLSLRLRLEAWQTAGRMIQDNPFFGVGSNLYHTLIPRYAAADNPYLGYAHNSYLQLGSELGIFGLAVVLVLLAGTVRREFSVRSFWIAKPDFYDFLFTGLLSLWMQSFLDNHFFSIQSSMLIALTWAALWANRAQRGPQTFHEGLELVS